MASKLKFAMAACARIDIGECETANCEEFIRSGIPLPTGNELYYTKTSWYIMERLSFAKQRNKSCIINAVMRAFRNRSEPVGLNKRKRGLWQICVYGCFLVLTSTRRKWPAIYKLSNLMPSQLLNLLLSLVLQSRSNDQS